MNAYLFVYGSLKTSLDHVMGQRLRREAHLMGPARVQGRLYRVKWYPGLTHSDDARDIVHGEVYRLADPVASLAWLDEYEGIARGALSAGEADEYRRDEIMARFADGTSVVASVYIFTRELADGARVVDGNWRG